MTCYAKIGNFEGRDFDPFGVHANMMALSAVKMFICSATAVSFTHAGHGIIPAIKARLDELNATEWYCDFSNKVKPTTDITFYYK